MRVIRPLLAAAGVALFGNAAYLLLLDSYCDAALQRLCSRHAAHGTGGFSCPPAKPPAAVVSP